MGQSLAILGMGLSGQAAAKLAQAQGDQVITFDATAKADAAEFSKTDLTAVDQILISPGFEASHPWRQCALASDKPCISEIEYAAEKWRGKIYGVTGTNGKTSLTELLAAAFCISGADAIACGNIGVPFSEVANSARNTSQTIAVCELSSFQAELVERFQLDGLLWTNFAPDHLDRYHQLSDYLNAKWKLVHCLKTQAPFFYGVEVSEAIEAHALEAKGSSVAVEAIDLSGLPVDSPFRHSPQQANLALAQALWQELGLGASALRQAAVEFKVPAYRFELVAQHAGVNFWNDSKATNFHAVNAALGSLSEGSVFWIGGGRAKGGNPADLVAILEGRITEACIYGECAPSLSSALNESSIPYHQSKDCGDAIRQAAHLAQANPPAHVLFSPGFASFDAFSSYLERGKYFDSIVFSL